MGECQIQRLAILDKDNQLVGIVSLGDLARARGNAPSVTETREEIKAPTKPLALGVDTARVGR